MSLEIGYDSYKVLKKSEDGNKWYLTKMNSDLDDNYCCGRSELTTSWGTYFDFSMNNMIHPESSIEAKIPVFKKELDGWYHLIVRDNKIDHHYLVSQKYINSHPQLMKPCESKNFLEDGFYYMERLHYVDFDDFKQPMFDIMGDYDEGVQVQVNYYNKKIADIKQEIHETRERQYIADSDKEFNNIEKVICNLKEELEDIMQEKDNIADTYTIGQINTVKRLLSQMGTLNTKTDEPLVVLPFYSF